MMTRIAELVEMPVRTDRPAVVVNVVGALQVAARTGVILAAAAAIGSARMG